MRHSVAYQSRAPSGATQPSADVDIYRFTPAIPVAGHYRVLALRNCHTNPCTAVPYDTGHAQAVNTVEVNQQLDGGQCNALGTFTFDVGSGGYVEVSDRNRPYAIADAGKLQYVGPPTD